MLSFLLYLKAPLEGKKDQAWFHKENGRIVTKTINT